LILDNNNLKDLKPLRHFPSLTHLSATGNQLGSLSSAIRHLLPLKKQLQYLDLRYNSFNVNFKFRYDRDDCWIRYICYRWCFYEKGFSALKEFDGELISNFQKEFEKYRKAYEIIKHRVLTSKRRGHGPKEIAVKPPVFPPNAKQ
jgi:hypothetical protein